MSKVSRKETDWLKSAAVGTMGGTCGVRGCGTGPSDMLLSSESDRSNIVTVLHIPKKGGRVMGEVLLLSYLIYLEVLEALAGGLADLI